MHAEDIVFEIIVRLFGGDESDAALDELKERIKSNFEKARIISQGSAEARIISVKIKKIGEIKC